jgi:hypothetical protein
MQDPVSKKQTDGGRGREREREREREKISSDWDCQGRHHKGEEMGSASK